MKQLALRTADEAEAICDATLALGYALLQVRKAKADLDAAGLPLQAVTVQEAAVSLTAVMRSLDRDAHAMAKTIGVKVRRTA